MRIFRRLITYMTKVVAYARLLWNDVDWDWVYILLLLRYKLVRTRECLKSENIISDVDDVCRQIRIAELLIDRIVANDYGRSEREKHDLKWGELNITSGEQRGASVKALFNREKAVTPRDKEQERQESRMIWEHEQSMANQDLDYLFRHLRKYLRNWWD